MKRIYLPLSFIFFIGCNSFSSDTKRDINPYRYSIQKSQVVTNGAVVSAHVLASKAGTDILKLGGNAIDAAIATQLALAVVYPGAGNLGGGGFMVARLQDGHEITLDFREAAPGKASRDMYLDPAGNALTEKSQNGHLSSGVPGTVAGLFAAAKYGRLSFDKLIQPAIDLAQKGFVITEHEANQLNSLQDEFKKYNTVMPVFVKNKPWRSGDTLIQADLAHTLMRIRDKGQAGFYEGETAKLIVEEMKRGSGIVSYEDLKNYKAIERKPHTFEYKSYHIIGMPMPSSGGLLLHQMMKMIENRDIGKMGFQTAASVQLMTEAERRAFADRAQYMGDADFYKVPAAVLTSDAYLADRMKDFVPGRAGHSDSIKPGNIIPYESKETTHLSVIDKDGNAVSVTTTLNNSYGSRTVVGGAGFVLNDEMDDFSIKPGTPNMYGAVGGEANAIAPHKRMLSSMCPVVVMKGNKVFLVAGTPGGTTIPTSVFQTLVNVIDFNLGTSDAVNRAKFHHQWLPDKLVVERGFSVELMEILKKMGYYVDLVDEIGRTEVIRVLPDGKFEAVADHRGDDDAEGW